MKGLRNPFHIRFAEQIGSDRDFLRLFSPGILDILPDTLWDRINVFRSAPGAGKTSLLRLFTPNALLTVYSYKDFEQYKDIYARMKEIGAINDEGPCVLAALLSCAHNYASLEDLDLDNARKERLLLSLLNVRIVLAILRSALTLRRYNYPEDLEKLQLECPPEVHLPPGVPHKGSGRLYYDWASQLEKNICESIDNLVPPIKDHLSGHDSLFGLWLLRPHSLLCDGSPIAERVVVMLDDVQKLTALQRKKLLSLIVDLRAPTKVWIAERLEALSTDELLSPGNTEGRDWNLIYLESYWQDHRKRFESFARNVADKRAESASEGEIASFAGCLEETFDWKDCKTEVTTALDHVSGRVHALADAKPKYREWITLRESTKGTPVDKLLGWRTLEILIERDLLKEQKTFGFIELTEENLQTQDQSDVRTAAELFISKEFGLPYYYGFTRLCSMASANIEQFLDLSGELFEGVASASILSLSKKMPEVKSNRQEKIVKQTVRRKWDEIVHRVDRPNDIRSLIESTGNFCKWETYKSNAPYSPGVTGIAVRMSDREKLRDPKFLEKDIFARLASIIASCLSYNIFEPVLDYKCKGQRWMVLYLNRMFCVHFDLPLQYGGWREKSLRELCHWIEKGFHPPKPKGDLF